MASEGRSAVNPATAVAAPPRMGDPYQPRPVRFIRLERRGDWRLKVYGIATPGRTPRAEFVTAALDLAPLALPEPAVTDERYGIGILVAHDSATCCFALFYWWQSANELHQRVYAAPLARPSRAHQAAGPRGRLRVGAERRRFRAAGLDRGRPGEPARPRPRPLPHPPVQR